MKLTKDQRKRIIIDVTNMMIFLYGMITIFAPVPVDVKILGGFLMGMGLTGARYDYPIRRICKEIDQLKDSKNQNTQN